MGSRLNVNRGSKGSRRQMVLWTIVSLYLLSGPACSHQSKPPVRIVLITLDTLRRDCFFAHDGETFGMPKTREFASRGQVFENFFSSSASTQPSHASMLTGLHPWDHGVVRNGMVLGDRFPTVTERLREGGFETAAVVASFPLEARFGFSRGFDHYDDDFTVPIAIDVWEGNYPVGGNFSSPAEAVTDRALDLLRRADGQKQFFWFHYFDPHSPYGASGDDPVQGHDLRKLAEQGQPQLRAVLEKAHRRYRQDVAYMDLHLGRLFEALNDSETDAQTHVIIVSDHGESFGEEGSIGHGRRLTREQIHVPCLIVSPRLEPRARSDRASSIDVAATLLSFAGISDSVPGSRDLTAEFTEDRPVMGMRRTYLTPYKEWRTDGTSVDIYGSWFFLCEGDTYYTGNLSEVVREDRKDLSVTEDARDRVIARFSEFARKLLDASADELVDAETRRALEAMGYTQ